MNFILLECFLARFLLLLKPLPPILCLLQRQTKRALPPGAAARAPDETAADQSSRAAAAAAASEASTPSVHSSGAEMPRTSSSNGAATSASNAATGRETNEILVHNISHSDAIIALAAAVNGQPRCMNTPSAPSSSSSSNGSGSYGRGGGGLQGEVILARPKFFAFAPVTQALLDDAAPAAGCGSIGDNGDGRRTVTTSTSSDGSGTPRKVELSYPTPVLTRDDQAPSHPLSFAGSSEAGGSGNASVSGGGSGVGNGGGGVSSSSGSAIGGATAAARARDAAAAARTFLPVGLRLDPPCCLSRGLVSAASANAYQQSTDDDDEGSKSASAAAATAAASAATATAEAPAGATAAASAVATAVKRSLAPLANILSFRKDDFKLLQDAVLSINLVRRSKDSFKNMFSFCSTNLSLLPCFMYMCTRNCGVVMVSTCVIAFDFVSDVDLVVTHSGGLG